MQNGILYFSSTNCAVCHVLYPKIEEMLHTIYPKLAIEKVITDKDPIKAAAHQVFSVPTIVVILDGKESFRFVRAFSVSEVEKTLARPYAMLFEES
jgi:thioredoxin-like negative regulator of GroEL